MPNFVRESFEWVFILNSSRKRNDRQYNNVLKKGIIGTKIIATSSLLELTRSYSKPFKPKDITPNYT